MSSTRLTPSHPAKPSATPIRTRVWTAGRFVFMTAALGVTFIAFFLTAMRVTNRAREVKAPDIRGKSIADARTLLANVGLVLKIDMRRPDPKTPVDHVLSQEPEPGAKIRRQRAIRVRVSDGDRAPLAPSVIGEPERTAELILAQAQIEIAGRAEVRTAAYPQNAVIGQDPPAKTPGTKIFLLINRGENAQSFVMPDVIGALGVRVVDLLRQRGFRVTVAAEVPYPGLPAGVIVRQTPQAGFEIEAGAPVQLEVSR